MRRFDPELTAHLDTPATTICTCWIVRRTDGVVLGFTDHDAPLQVDGTLCEAASGFEPSTAVAELGLAADNQQIAGALRSGAIEDDALARGDFDDATVEVWLVNWQEPDRQAHHMRSFVLGEISRNGDAFSAELRGTTSRLDQPIGRAYARACDASLGDARCGIDLTLPQWHADGQVSETLDRKRLVCSGLDGHASGLFTAGQLRWTSGANAGLAMEVAGHDGGRLTLWQAMPLEIADGDTFTVTAGCDKSFAQCRARFGNHLAFRGFPHMPGHDRVLGYADRDTVHDGSPLVR